MALRKGIWQIIAWHTEAMEHHAGELDKLGRIYLPEHVDLPPEPVITTRSDLVKTRR